MIADLARLGLTHFVEITTTEADGVWHLEITNRRGGYRATTYRGDLGEIVALALLEALG